MDDPAPATKASRTSLCPPPRSFSPLFLPAHTDSFFSIWQPSSVFRGVVDVVENLEKLVDVGCITKADLVRFPHTTPPPLTAPRSSIVKNDATRRHECYLTSSLEFGTTNDVRSLPLVHLVGKLTRRVPCLQVRVNAHAAPSVMEHVMEEQMGSSHLIPRRQ